MNEKEVPATDLVKPLEELIERAHISAPGEEKRRLEEELSSLASSSQSATKVNDSYRKVLAAEAQRIVSSEWFSLCSSKSSKLKNFAALAGAVRKQ